MTETFPKDGHNVVKTIEGMASFIFGEVDN